ncbi:hypothetical protein [Xanthomonas sp. WHRI 6106]|uniref:hypothetical protein n=1 Tax=Xanthomonas sp. WHRI 6106 TaxID=3161566 RepID=UPI0032E92224
MSNQHQAMGGRLSLVDFVIPIDKWADGVHRCLHPAAFASIQLDDTRANRWQ